MGGEQTDYPTGAATCKKKSDVGAAVKTAKRSKKVESEALQGGNQSKVCRGNNTHPYTSTCVCTGHLDGRGFPLTMLPRLQAPSLGSMWSVVRTHSFCVEDDAGRHTSRFRHLFSNIQGKSASC
jgi:hypothetical protein